MHHRDLHQGIRRLSLAHAAKCVVENLEKRQLLAGDVFNVNKLPVYTPTSGDISDFKNGPLGNVSGLGAELYVEYRRFVNKGGKPSQFKSANSQLVMTSGNVVAVDLRVRSSMDSATKLVRSVGGQLIYRAKALSVVEAIVPIGQLNTLARAGQVASINALTRPVTKSVGDASNQAEAGQNIDSLQSTFNLDGDGVKIGVISDSVNNFEGGLADSYASGDLPPPVDIDVIADGDPASENSDEGRAMLELIHDLAPKASLAFAGAGASQLTFADSIRRLYDAGSDVIVDDIGFASEPIFQEGILNAAITNVTQAGAVYVSAAGNASNAGYQAITNWVVGPDGRTYMDWDSDPNHVDTSMRVKLVGSGGLSLQWDNPYNGIVGAATTDLDIQFSDPVTGAIFFRGDSDNLATGLPTELFSVSEGSYDIELIVNNRADGSDLPSRIAMLGAQTLSGSFADAEYKPKAYTTIDGHSGGLDTLSVGAVPFWETPAYDTDGLIESEDFTSYGPNTFIFKMNGERRSQPLVAVKPWDPLESTCRHASLSIL